MNIKIFNNDLPSDIDLSNEKVVALDNEALGLVLGRDPLTLVQIGLASNQCFLIKLNRDNYEAPNLKKFLSNSNTQFIMHYARQDLLWIKYHLKVEINNIFCTKLASKIARTASNYHGYKDLVKELCGKDISKKEQQSDWGNPNLSTKQINYAANDVLYCVTRSTLLIFIVEPLMFNGSTRAPPLISDFANNHVTSSLVVSLR